MNRKAGRDILDGLRRMEKKKSQEDVKNEGKKSNGEKNKKYQKKCSTKRA